MTTGYAAAQQWLQRQAPIQQTQPTQVWQQQAPPAQPQNKRMIGPPKPPTPLPTTSWDFAAQSMLNPNPYASVASPVQALGMTPDLAASVVQARQPQSQQQATEKHPSAPTSWDLAAQAMFSPTQAWQKMFPNLSPGQTMAMTPDLARSVLQPKMQGPVQPKIQGPKQPGQSVDWGARGQQIDDLAAQYVLENILPKVFASTTPSLPAQPSGSSGLSPYFYPNYPYYDYGKTNYGMTPSQNYPAGWYTRLLSWNVNRG